MSDGYYLDIDVVLKTCSYGAGLNLLDLSTTEDLPPAMLALARFMLPSRIERSQIIVDKAGAAAQVDTVLAAVRLIEPTEEEVELAADLEAAAMEANLFLEAGETQLVAMMIARGGRACLSGDKRTATALIVLTPTLQSRLFCLEQVLHSILMRSGFEPLRSAVAREAAVDPAVTVIFQCAFQQVALHTVLHGLDSYSKALRTQTGGLMVDSLDMSGANNVEEESIRSQ